MSLGMPTKYATTFGTPAKITATFGKGLYITSASTAGSGGASNQNTQANGFTTYGVPRSPVYTTVLGDSVPMVRHSPVTLLADVRDVLGRSSYLPSKQNINVQVKDGVVLLSGQVASDSERRSAEGMVRMTPGVQGVDNQLVVVPAATPTALYTR